MNRKKLTLSVDERVIRRAKRFSKRHGKSVSQLVSEFLASLGSGSAPETPIVTRLRGILPRTASRDEHRRHLEKKHRR